MFGTKTLNSILASFAKTAAELEAFSDSAKKQRQANTDRINVLMEENTAIGAEINQAHSAATAIKALIGSK